MRLPIKPMIVMIVDVIMMTSLSVSFCITFLANFFFFSPKGMPHITKVMCCFIYLWDLLLKGRLIMGMARCGEPSPFLRVGSFRAVKSRFATALDRSPLRKT